MKAISLWQPWASLMAIGEKRFETRSWKPPLWPDCRLRHPILAIHAAASEPLEARQLVVREPFESALSKHGLSVNATRPAGGLPRGAIVAIANFKGFERTETVIHRISEQERSFGDYTPGRYAWETLSVRRLKEPIACRGRQGIWDVPPDVERQVLEQMEAKA